MSPLSSSVPELELSQVSEPAHVTCGRARPTVLLADDHVVWRRGLRDVLEPEFEIVAEAGEGNEAVQKAVASRPNVVVMDIRMRGMDGIAAAHQIREALPDTGVVMITAADDDEQIHASLRAGASGYVVKDDTAAVMVQAVRAVAQGHAFLPPSIANSVLQGMRSMDNAANTRKTNLDLTNREVGVLRLVAEGYRHKEIARALGISTRTVGNHVANIYNKLGIDDRAHAIVYAIKKGIIKP